MTTDTLVSASYGYTAVAVIAGVTAALLLAKRLKARIPDARPYRWGYYVGSMGVACAPWAALLALSMAVGAVNGQWEAVGECLVFSLFFTLHTICGWFIIQRKRWAWVVGTVFSCNPILWLINYAYARNRWGEFAGQFRGSAGTEDEGYELLADALKVEQAGRIQEALSLYQRVADAYAHTNAGQDARKSIESLRAIRG
jgi:hypothetical protein